MAESKSVCRVSILAFTTIPGLLRIKPDWTTVRQKRAFGKSKQNQVRTSLIASKSSLASVWELTCLWHSFNIQRSKPLLTRISEGSSNSKIEWSSKIALISMFGSVQSSSSESSLNVSNIFPLDRIKIDFLF